MHHYLKSQVVRIPRAAVWPLAAMILGSAPLPSSVAQVTNFPALTYSCLFGSTSGDIGCGMARDPAGYIYVVGQTGWADTFSLPFTARFDPTACGWGTFVAKFDPTNHTFLYRTLLAGCNGRAVAVDASGNTYITGECYRDGSFPATRACQPDYGGGDLDAFAAKLSPDGSQLLYATFLGGSRVDWGRGIAVDGAGQAVVMGLTESTNFPTSTQGVIQTNLAGGRDTFVVKLGVAGTNVLYATYLGGRRNDDGMGLAVDTNGNVFISGRSTSTNFATVPNPTRLGPVQASDLGKAFVAKLAPDLSAVRYLTLFGGSGQDCGSALALDGAGNAFVFGQTDSADFPVSGNAFQSQLGGGMDNFVVKLNAAGSSLLYATYLGGDDSENHLDTLYISDNYPYWYLPAAGIAVDSAGNAFVAGRTESDDLAQGVPTANQRSGYADGYVAKINPSGSALLYLRYLGSYSYEAANALALDGSGKVFVTGLANYSMFPPYFPITPGTVPSGGEDEAFLAELSETVSPPSNDDFANRTLLRGPARMTVQANNAAATVEPGEPAHAGHPGGKSLWWSWTAPVHGALELTTLGSSFDTLLAVYTGSTLDGLHGVTNKAASPSQVRFPVVAGTTYQIAVAGQDGASGSLTLSLTFSAPPNDDFANRLPLSGYQSVFGFNVEASLEPDEALIPRNPDVPLHVDWFGSRSVWWSWTAPEDTDVEISTLGSDFNTCLAVYTGSILSNLVILKSSGEEVLSNGLFTSRVTLKANAGTHYQIAVNGIYDTSGRIQLNLFPTAPPTNDNFGQRTVLTGNLISLTNYNTTATTEPDEPTWGFAGPGGRTLWWTWTAPSNGWVKLSTEGSDFDTHLAVLTGNDLTHLTLVVANDEYLWWVPYSFHSRLTFEVSSNATYIFMVDGSARAPSGRLVFNLFFSQPPRILPSTVGWSSGRYFGFQVQGQGRPYRVETSTNLSDWTLAPATNLFGPAFEFRETNGAASRQRFYRVLQAD